MEAKLVTWMLQGPAWLRFAFKKQILGQDPDPTPAVSCQDIRALVQVLRSPDRGFPALAQGRVSYTILRVLDVLSRYPRAAGRPEFQEMLGSVRHKAEDGRYKVESMAKMFKGFDFGQRKEPSRWITFLVQRIEKRVAANG